MQPVDDAERAAAAAELADAEKKAKQIRPLTETYPSIDVEDAYAVQQIQIDEKVAAGQIVRGHKIGLSARAMQQMLGVDEPDFGHLLDGMFVADLGTIDSSVLCQPHAEFEIAFVLGATLPGQGCTVADVLRCAEFVAPSIEVIDTRIRDWKIKLCDTIADKASSARVVLGAHAKSPADLDLRTVGCVGRVNGEIVATGTGGAVLGHPAAAVAWLANRLHAFGVVLEAGEVIIPGSCTQAIEVNPGDVVRADFDGLGHVAVCFS